MFSFKYQVPFLLQFKKFKLFFLKMDHIDYKCEKSKKTMYKQNNV